MSLNLYFWSSLIPYIWTTDVLLRILPRLKIKVNKTTQKIRRGEEKNGIDDRGSVHPSGDQIKVVMETRSSSKKKSPGI